jgi:glycosyltransferase involved in cell wall biosynthesis
MPKVSIIIPCYKVEKYLKRCLDSVLAQTFCEWEAICVDDGSPDNCGQILDEYAKLDSRFKVIHQEN